MPDPTRKFLKSHTKHAATVFNALIAEMKAKSVTKTLLTFHPSYGLSLGIAGTDQGFDVLDTTVELVPNFDSAYPQFESAEKLDPDSGWFDDVYAWDWVRECWLVSKGPKSGCWVVLMDNGIGDETDLTTGEPPLPELGFEDIG